MRAMAETVAGPGWTHPRTSALFDRVDSRALTFRSARSCSSRSAISGSSSPRSARRRCCCCGSDRTHSPGAGSAGATFPRPRRRRSSGRLDGLAMIQSTAVGGLFGRTTVVETTASSSCSLLRPMVNVTPWYSPSLAVMLVTRTSWNSARYCFCCSGVACRQKRPRQKRPMPSTSTSASMIWVICGALRGWSTRAVDDRDQSVAG